jgi:Protein of unknown function (DUF2924)
MAKLRLRLRPGLNKQPDTMQKKRRNGRTSTKTSVEDEIAHLRGLDLKGLRSRWQSAFQRSAPAHLTRHLLFAVIAYRLQADRFGDLDHATRQVLDRTVTKEAGPAMSAQLASFDQKRTELTPGTVLVREWDRQSRSHAAPLFVHSRCLAGLRRRCFSIRTRKSIASMVPIGLRIRRSTYIFFRSCGSVISG